MYKAAGEWDIYRIKMLRALSHFKIAPITLYSKCVCVIV